MGADDKKDLRKEVEMTEHSDSIDKVIAQYETHADNGLSEAVAAQVRFSFGMKI